MTKARTTPGHSVSRRLSGRSHTRANVGPRSGFFHRLGIQDPFALSAAEGRSDRARSELSAGNPFVYLSSAAYFEEVEASRYRLLERLQASRETERIGERLERVGPVAMGIRPADTVLYGGMTTLTLPPEEVDELPEEIEQARPSKARYAAWPERQKPAPAARRSLVRVRPQPIARVPAEPVAAAARSERTPFQRVARRASPPMHRAYARTSRAGAGTSSASRISRVVERVAADLRGPEREELLRVIETVSAAPTPAKLDTARRALRRLRGTASVVARQALGRALPEAAGRPTDDARGRISARGEAPTRGLRRILQSSPSLTLADRPEQVFEDVARTEPVAPRAAPSEPTAARRPSSTRAASRGSAVVSRTPVSRPVRSTSPRRPSASVVGRGVLADRAARSEVSRGVASPRAPEQMDRALVRADSRRASGVVDPASRSPLAGAATSWLRGAPPTETGTTAPRRAGPVSPELPLLVAGPAIDVDAAAPAEGSSPVERQHAAVPSKSSRRASAPTARVLSRDLRQSPRIASSPARAEPAVPARLHPAIVARERAPHAREVRTVDGHRGFDLLGPPRVPAAPRGAEAQRQPPALHALARTEAAPSGERLTAAPTRFSRTLDALSLVLPRPEGAPDPVSDAAAAETQAPRRDRAAAPAAPGRIAKAAVSSVSAPVRSELASVPGRPIAARSVTPGAWRASRRATAPARQDGRGSSMLRSSPTASVPSRSTARPLPTRDRELRTGQVARAASRSVSTHRVSERGERLLAPALPGMLLAAQQVVDQVEQVQPAPVSSAAVSAPRVRASRRPSGHSATASPSAPRQPAGRRSVADRGVEPVVVALASLVDQVASLPTEAAGPMVRAATRSREGGQSTTATRAPLSRSPLTWLEPDAADEVLQPAADVPFSGTASVRPATAARASAVRAPRPAYASTGRAERRDSAAVRLDRSGRALLAPVALSHLSPDATPQTSTSPGAADAPARTPGPAVSRQAGTRPQPRRGRRIGLAPAAHTLGRAPTSRDLGGSLVPQAARAGDLSSLLPELRALRAEPGVHSALGVRSPERILPQGEPLLTEDAAAAGPAPQDRVAAAISAALRTQRSVVSVDAVRRATTEDTRKGPRSIEARLREVDGQYRVRQQRSASATTVWLTDMGSDASTEPGRAPAAAWAESRADGLPSSGAAAPASRVVRRWAEPGAAPSLAAGRARVQAHEDDSDADTLRGPLRFRTPTVGLGDMTLAALPQAEVGDPAAEGATERPSGLRRTLGRLAADDERPRTRAAERQIRRTRGLAPEARTLAEAREPGVGRKPAWSRHAEGEGVDVPSRELPLREARVATMGRLLGALARSGDPEEIVKVVLESSDSLERAAADLPGATRSMVERLVRSAGEQARSGTRASRVRAAQPSMLAPSAPSPSPSSAGSGGSPSGGGGGGSGRRPAGSSRVMKLANKLMKLIHLAETERRAAEAQRQVRMSEETADSRRESGAGQAGGENDDKKMNIKALRQDVLEAVLRELENIRWRREDPDGPSIWC